MATWELKLSLDFMILHLQLKNVGCGIRDYNQVHRLKNSARIKLNLKKSKEQTPLDSKRCIEKSNFLGKTFRPFRGRKKLKKEIEHIKILSRHLRELLGTVQNQQVDPPAIRV